MIDVSVIIAAYNAEKNLRQCLESVLAQTLRSIEVIVVNDGSGDGTQQIAEQMAKCDARVRVINQENAGAGAARNAGLAAAKGQYLSFLDADDFFESDMLERALNAAQAENAQITVFRADFYNERTGSFSPCTYSVRTQKMPAYRPFAAQDVERDLFKTVRGWAWDKLFETAYVKELGLQFENLRTTNDMTFVFSALAAAKRITTLDAVLVHQRRHAGGTLSVTREKSWGCFYEALKALERFLRREGIYERFESDYINYALHFSLWHLNTLKGPAKRALYDQLRRTWFEELDIKGRPAAQFYSAGEYMQYRLVMAMPYNAAIAGLTALAQRGGTYLRRKLLG